uniref:Ig-like domain-containing protein n=1 Tax=Labrus bergylta TaxID=56723 RepID=A0A3Q3GI72_9LABR
PTTLSLVLFCIAPSTARESLARPQFVEKLRNITVRQGTLVELAVKAIGNPLPDIVWLKNSDIITPQKHPHIKYVSSNSDVNAKVILQRVVAYARDSGVITCRATNKFGVDQTSATLIVKDEKGLVEESQLPEGRRAPHRMDEIEPRVLEGDIARFRCRVTGYPAPKVNWYLNGQLIRKSKRYRLRYDGIYYLEIVDIKSYDSGEVRIVADNPLGTTEHTVKLEIQQKEDFRSVLRRAPESKAAEASHEGGRTGFDVVKVDRPVETAQDREVVKLNGGEYTAVVGHLQCSAALTVEGTL